jgi:vacuolar-type H+-ATPase subunit E/Vma4
MTSEDPNIEALSRAVMRDAHTDAEHVMAEAQVKADKIRQHAQEEAAALRAEILEHANREAERIKSEMISSAQLKARALQLEQREKLLDEVHEAAHQKLNMIQHDTDYEQIVRRLLREALLQLGVNKALVRADSVTQKFFTDELIAEISKETGVQMQIGDTLDKGIGVVVETLDGHRRYENTLEVRRRRLWDSLRSPVYHLLAGEPL